MPRPVPWWAVVSAALAPVFLIGGWTVATALQPAAYNPVHDTISSLAGYGATDRWVMSVAIVGLGACHGITALGLRPAARPGRIVLALGALGTLLVAAFPVPADGPSIAHGLAAGLGFAALAVWPVRAWRPQPTGWGLRQPVALTAAAVLSVLIAVFAVELYDLVSDGSWIGVTERIAAGAEALWPLVVVVSAVVSGGWPTVRNRAH